jgi:predicted GNAT family acetyltransferase
MRVPAHVPAPRPAARALQPADERHMRQFLLRDGGYGLFITSNLLAYGATYPGMRFWGQFASSGDLEAIGMIANSSASVYAPTGAAIQPLLEIILRERLRFIMGRADLISQAHAAAAQPIERLEIHRYAELAPKKLARVSAPDDATRVRRGYLGDVAGLAQLYYGSDGFERLSLNQIRHVMHNRVTQLRTYLAEQDGAIIAAASTSAEAYDAALIGGVWTTPQSRGRGMSSAVVGALCGALARERKRPYLFYLHDNAAAARVYAKLGFRVTGEWRVLYFGDR